MAEENGNGKAGEKVARIEGARDRLSIPHLLTAAGILATVVYWIDGRLDENRNDFATRISALDTALQREARDLDRTLDVQIQHVKEVESMNSTRFVEFIYALREWQLERIEEEAYSRGQTDARLDALERSLQR